MENTVNNSPLMAVVSQFNFVGDWLEDRSYGTGHINDTYLLDFKEGDGEVHHYVLQRINTDIFKNPHQVMENIHAVTEFLSKRITLEGGDPSRETLQIVKTKTGGLGYEDEKGNYWRAYDFIRDSLAIDMVEKPEQFYESAVAFGSFQAALADFPADSLHATIPDFHHTPKRLENFKLSVEKNISGRAKNIQDDIDFVLGREDFTHTLIDLHKAGQLPLKVTHNDTKLNNVLFDKETEKALCVIDLDTIMPGFSLDDFGDSIRFGATTGAEDEPDLSKVNFSYDLYELYTEGFLKGANGTLSDLEISLFPVGAKMMTLECGMRFLGDYLDGDVYFKTAHDNHNLDRARTQFKLVADMEAQWDKLEKLSLKFI